MPPGISIKRAIRTMAEATDKAGANRGPRAGRVGLGCDTGRRRAVQLAGRDAVAAVPRHCKVEVPPPAFVE